MEIPYSKEIARYYSEGTLPADINETWKSRFYEFYERIKESAV